MIGDVIEHYRILDLVGRGAMGVVYKALDLNLDRTVAIKVMSAEARNDPDFVERFRQEARMQAALNHPNVALLFDYFVNDDAPVAVMEYIDGQSLEQMIRRRGPIPAYECIPLFKQALQGVAAAHRAGIIHRDLKTANLMVTRDSVVKVMDFGIAKRQSGIGATKASTSIGSPLYMAPEQILGHAVDARTDVYALGITLYQLLSGQPPFNPRGKTEYSVLNAHVNDLPEPPTVHFRDIPQPIVDAVMRALAKEPDARFQSAEEFMRALPDIAAPATATPRVEPSAPVGPTGTVPIARLGRTGTVAIPRVGPTGTVAIPREGPTGTTAIEYSPPPTDAVKSGNLNRTIEFDYVPSPRATVPTAAPVQRAPARRAAFAAVLFAALIGGGFVRHAHRLHAMTQASTSSEPAAAPAAAPVATAVATAQPVTAPVPATAPAQPDLAGTWHGAYLDAAGKQLLRVVSLSISHIQDDGGIEGTLQYQAASGEGECQLHPRGSTYSSDARRLQLSPESCSPHYPKELGVPLDFNAVDPQADTLKDGRIEAPTGEIIKVRLTRVTGV